MKKLLMLTMFVAVASSACKKDNDNDLRYYEVAASASDNEWRDSSFVVATSDPGLITEIEAQLQLPVAERKIVNGALVRGNGGYNKNAGHSFKWHFREDDWHLTDMSAEIFDGRAYTDVDVNIGYWLDTVKRFSPWSSYIKREIR
jgi:hypothetical protein